MLATAALWGLAVIASFAGWGSWLRRRLVPTLEVDWGLRAAWGLALTIAVGGPLVLLRLARGPVLACWMLGGIALAGRELVAAARARPELVRRPWRLVPLRWDVPVLAALLAVTAFVYVGAAAQTFPNPSDDWLAYLPFVKMIQQTGTFIDPFNVRRMASLGGQSYLQALTQLVARDSELALFDRGICLLLVVWLVNGAARGASRLAPLLLTLFVLALPEIRVNSASEMSGVVGFLALYRSIVLAERGGLGGTRGALVVALPAAAVWTLRQNYIAVVVVMLGALLLPGARVADAPDAGAAPDLRARVRQLARVAGLVAALLAPWAILAYQSNHTFLFPLIPGYYDPTYAGITAPSSLDARLHFYFQAAFHDEPVRTMPLLLIAALGVARGVHRRAMAGLWAGVVIGFALLALSLPDADNFTVARYDFGYVVAFAIAAGLAAAERAAAETAPGVVAARVDRLVVGAILVAFAVQLEGARGAAIRNLDYAWNVIRARNEPSPLAVRVDDVRRLQDAVPRGEKLMVMFERPYLLDFRRNAIVHLDQPGAASPPPHLPLAAGGEPIAAYLLGQGIRYFAFVRPDRSESEIYSRVHWKKALGSRMRVWRITAPLFLQAFDAVDELARTRRHLYDDGHWVAVDLATRAG
jgi:hypothetical protein